MKNEIELTQDPSQGLSFTEKQYGLNPVLNNANNMESVKSKDLVLTAPALQDVDHSSQVRSTFDSRPINTVDTFGVNPTITAANTLIAPASAPITFEYAVTVPQGRTYVLRQFYFVPTRFIFDENNNPINDLFHLTFFVNNQPVSENSNLTFPTWGTGGYVEAFIIAPENTTIKLRAQITNPAYLDMDFTFNTFINASINMRFNALLSNSEPPNFQIANKRESNSVTTKTLDGLPMFRKYVRPDRK